ncbi:hypothetical protein D0863_02746 [Hortaea werneckii]|uniref:Uncharacterized protein n=1 Tax=Hortaea werneckii TaxID=91943 RepID=A0A3M7EFS7_HORWE|nr:hypothetical protein D0863_02746 [Hortaea werneckii]
MRNTGTASITKEPVLQASSIASSSPQQTHTSELFTVQPDAMAGLAAFNLRGWISGSSVKPEQQKSKSTEKSLRGQHGQHVGTSRALSYGSDEYEVINSEFENAKAETLNAMKEYNKADGDRGSAEKQESAAQRLQRVHESLANAREKQWPDKKPSKSPPKDSDFPALGIGHATSKKELSGLKASQAEMRKSSYASVASTSIKDASNEAQSKPRSEQSHERVDNSSTSIDEPGMPGIVEDDEATVIQISTKEATTSPYGKATPHFAQPTKSFARRAGETALRKDSVGARTAELSPGKSTQARELFSGTDRHTTQHLSKRGSIPGSWMTADSPTKPAPAGKSLHRGAVTSVASDVDEWQFVDSSDAVKLNATAQEEDDQNVSKKKTSSYMLPTAAATRRAVATAGQDQAKKPGTLRINTNRASQGSLQPSPVSASAKSAASSVDEVLTEKRLAGNQNSPRSPQRKDQQVLRPHATQRTAPSSPVRLREAERQKAKVATPKTTSKIPQSQKARDSPQSETLGNVSPRSMPVHPLVAVPNTVAKRRTSHADILKPIFDKLDSQGLLKTNREYSAIAEDKDEREIGAKPKMVDRGDFPETPRRMTPELAQIALLARQGVGVTGKALSPHLRSSRQTSIASTEADISAVNIVTEIKAGNCSKQAFRTPSSDGAVFESAPTATLKSSLRATAQVFKPLWQPQGPAQELSLLSWQGKLDHMPAESWSAMPPDVQHSILRLRDFSSSPSKRQNMRFWGNLLQAIGLPSPVPALAPRTPRRENKAVAILDKDGNTIMSNASSNEVKAGQVLKPTLSPSKKSVNWTVMDLDGKQKPVSFGRAGRSPMPLTETQQSHNDIAVASPSSEGSGPWTIGSGTPAPSRSSYGWKGGDGKEIRFQGHGPQAERNTRSPVRMQYGRHGGYHGRASSSHSYRVPYASPFSNTQLYSFNAQEENDSPPTSSERVWPRSRKQWAEMMGYSHVPCGNIEITQATEALPLGNPAFGCCHKCMGPNGSG